MGNIFQQKGDLDKAMKYYEKSREINIKNFGENHHGLANIYGNIGIIFHQKGDIDKALEYQDKS